MGMTSSVRFFKTHPILNGSKEFKDCSGFLFVLGKLVSCLSFKKPSYSTLPLNGSLFLEMWIFIFRLKRKAIENQPPLTYSRFTPPKFRQNNICCSDLGESNEKKKSLYKGYLFKLSGVHGVPRFLSPPKQVLIRVSGWTIPPKSAPGDDTMALTFDGSTSGQWHTLSGKFVMFH